jgi:hypothetical protein
MYSPEQAANSVMPTPCSLKFLDDGLLVDRAKAGDSSAFAELGERHSTKVLRTLYRITRNRTLFSGHSDTLTGSKTDPASHRGLPE